MKLHYGLLGILAILPAVSPLSARAEETPAAEIVEQSEATATETVTTLTPGAGVPALETTPQPPPSEGGGESNPLLTNPGGGAVADQLPPPNPLLGKEGEAITDPCAICPVTVVTAAPITPAPPPPPAPITPVAPTPIVAPPTTPAASTTGGSTGASIPTSAPTAKPTSYPSKSILINEFVSDPADGVEWIEIVNTTEDEIDLTEWTVKDATTSKTALPTQTLPGHAYFVLQNPKGKLNNDGDSIFLFDGTGATIDAISYDKTTAPKKGKSLARMEDGSWISADPSPLATNQRVDAKVDPNTQTYATTNDTATTLGDTQSDTGTNQGTDTPSGTPSPVWVERVTPVEAPIEAASTRPASTADQSPPPTPLLGKEGEANQGTPVIDASEITNYAVNATVTVEGVLVAAPGTFGKQLAYVDGLEIYFKKADWPKLSTMTRVRVTGTVDVKADYARLKIKKRTDIKVLDEDSVAPDALETLDDARHGLLMSLTGVVADVSGKNLTVGLNNGELITATSAKDASVDFSELAYDDRIAVTGVVRLVKGNWVLTMLDQAGLTRLQDAQTTPEVAIPSKPPSSKEGGAILIAEKITSPLPPPWKGGGTPWVGGGLLTTSIGALGYWFAKAKGITLPSFS